MISPHDQRFLFTYFKKILLLTCMTFMTHIDFIKIKKTFFLSVCVYE